MFSNEPQTVFLTAQAQFDANLSFASRLSEVAEELYRHLKPSDWSAKYDAYNFIDMAQKWIYSIQHNQVFCHTMGLDAWTKNSDLLLKAAQIGMEKCATRDLKAIKFDIRGFFDLGMSHEELFENLCGTLLPERKGLDLIFPGLNDSLVHYFGQINGCDYQLDVIPQKPEEAKRNALGLPNIRIFQKDPLVPGELGQFIARCEKPMLFIKVEIKSTTVRTSGAAEFWRSALKTADGLADAIIRRVRALPFEVKK